MAALKRFGVGLVIVVVATFWFVGNLASCKENNLVLEGDKLPCAQAQQNVQESLARHDEANSESAKNTELAYMSHTIVDSPSCFDATTLGNARTFLAQSGGQ
jgi:hypothetical protein